MNFGYVEEMETRSDQFSQSMKNAQSNAADAGSEIANAFQRALASVEELTEALDNLKEPVGRISESLELVAKVDFSGMSSDLAEISATLTDVLEKLQETDWIGIAGLVMQAFSQGFDIFSWMNPKDFSKVEELGIPTAGITDFVQTEVLPSKVLGTANYADELAEAAAGSGMLSVGFNKLREALDGVNLSQIAATASQWIQNAAVTAWNGICGVASAVTTAFGAAMNFLTSPIGLVTAGIAALIAIIVLLVANWDTVTAALASFDAWLTGIFAVNWKQQFGAFGEVLNAFFANVENIWNAVKTIFNGIVEFVKGVFAGDWQKGHQREAVCFRKCCKGAMLPKVDDPRRRGVYLKKD